MKKKTNLLLSLENLSFCYGNKTILKDIFFELPYRSFVSIIGESGSGKSTLLYILAGLLRPDSGKYIFEESSIQRMGKFSAAQFRRKNIGILFQDFRLLPFLTAEQNIKLPLYFLPEKIDDHKVDHALNELKIAHRKKAYPKDLSGGEAQRTAMARATILEPKLLLLDEPTGNLDQEIEKNILQYLMKFREKQGLTIVCVTHSKYMMQQSDAIWSLKEATLRKKGRSARPLKKRDKKI